MKFEDKVAILRKEKHNGIETKAFLEDVILMTQGEPLEYLMGEVMFCGAKIDLSFRPMVPRYETEFWVEKLIKELQNQKAKFVVRALDLFSGSGNVGIALLKNIPEATVDMIEINPRLKEQIELSLAKNNIKKTRARAITGDVFDGAVGTYDIITVVPPYVSPEYKDSVMKELAAEEPLSFFDKEDGFYFHTMVLDMGKHFLKEEGVLYLEADNHQVEKLKKLAEEKEWKVEAIWDDPYGNPYVLVCKHV